MALVTPILKKVAPFDKSSNYTFEFTVLGGDQVVANQLIIEKVSDNSQVYNNKINTFNFKHTINSNTLTNGVKYRAKIKTFNISNASSEYSDSILFYCFSNPIVTIPSLVGVVNSNNVDLVGLYSQIEGESAQSYRYYLYDDNSNLLSASVEKFDSDYEHTFSGLLDNGHYKAELKVYTVNGMIASSGLIPFDVNYISPIFNTAIVLENVGSQASIKINAHIINIIGEVLSGTPTYIDSEWINLKNSSIYFQDGFHINNDFSLKIWLKDINNGETLIELSNKDGQKIIINFENNKFYVYKITDNLTPYFVCSNEIFATPSEIICVQLQQIGDLLNIECGLVGV